MLLIAPQPFYQDRGTPIAVKYVLTALTQLGYTADLLTYPIGATPKIDGVNYVRTSNPLRFRNVPVSFSLRKVFLDLLIAGRLLRLLKRNKYVYVHAVEEAAFLAVIFKRLHKTRIVYDMASSIPEQLAMIRLFRFRPLMSLFCSIERWLLRNVDVVVASAGLKGKVEQISPGCDVREWYFPAAKIDVSDGAVARLRREYSIPDNCRVIVYTGTFEPYQGIGELLGAIPKVIAADSDTAFVLVGAKNQSQVVEIQSRLEHDAVSHVRVIERKSRAEIDAFLKMADILISSRKSGLNIPLKIFDYLAAEKPIVVTDIAAHRAIVDESLVEIVSPDASGIANGIIRILTDHDRARELVESSTKFSEQVLSWSAFTSFVGKLAK